MSNLRHFQPFEIEYTPQHFEAILAPEVITYRVRRDLISLGVSHSAQLDITRNNEDGNIFTVVGLTADESVRQLITDLANRKPVNSKIVQINLGANKTAIPNLDSPFTTPRNKSGKANFFEPDKKVTSFATYRLNKKGRSKASSSTHVANESPGEDDTEPNKPLASSPTQTTINDEPMDSGQVIFSQKEPERDAEKIVRLEMELKNVKQDLKQKTHKDQIIIDGLNARILELEQRLRRMERDREILKVYVGNIGEILGNDS